MKKLIAQNKGMVLGSLLIIITLITTMATALMAVNMNTQRNLFDSAENAVKETEREATELSESMRKENEEKIKEIQEAINKR